MLNFNRKNEFYQRLWVSAISISIVTFLVAFAYHPWANVLLILTIAALTGVGVWEYAQLAKGKGIQPATNLMIGVAVLDIGFLYFAGLSSVV